MLPPPKSPKAVVRAAPPAKKGGAPVVPTKRGSKSALMRAQAAALAAPRRPAGPGMPPEGAGY